MIDGIPRQEQTTLVIWTHGENETDVQREALYLVANLAETGDDDNVALGRQSTTSTLAKRLEQLEHGDPSLGDGEFAHVDALDAIPR